MERGILWTAAVVLAAMALVAGCAKVDIPHGPYVTVNSPTPQPTQQEIASVKTMDRQTLENEVLRLVAENDALRQDNANLKRDNKSLKNENKQLKDQLKNQWR